MKHAYLKGIILFILALIATVGLPIIIGFASGNWVHGLEGDLIIIWPFNGMPAFWDGVLSALFVPLMIFMGGLVGGYLLTPIYLEVHHILYRKSRFYGFIERTTKPSIGRWLRRGILPALFAIHIGLFLAQITVVQQAVLNPDFFLFEHELTLLGLTWGYTALIASFVTILVVVPTWFLDDSGLVVANINLEAMKLSESDELPNITGVGHWLARLLKGYAGIAVLITYFMLVSQAIILGWTAVITFGPQELPFFISTIITLPLGPVYQVLLTLPLLMVLDVISERRRRYVLRFAERKGISTTLSVSIHEKK